MAAVCAVGVLVGLLVWSSLCCVIFLILCCFLLTSLCGGCLCSGALVGLLMWSLCWMMILKLCCFLLSSVCGGCVCSGVSSGTKGVGCVLEDVSKTMLFSVA